jgi:hypothetical protein
MIYAQAIQSDWSVKRADEHCVSESLLRNVHVGGLPDIRNKEVGDSPAHADGEVLVAAQLR